MLKKTLAFGLLAASAIGFAIPAQAQSSQQNSQVIHSTTVSANGSSATSINNQNADNFTSEYGGYVYDANLQGNQQWIDSTTVGANGSSAYSNNAQNATNTTYDTDYGYGYVYYDEPAFQTNHQGAGSSTVSANGSRVFSGNSQDASNFNAEQSYEGWLH